MIKTALAILSIRLLNADTCVPNELTTSPVTAKCDTSPKECRNCEMSLTNAELLNCGVSYACTGMTAAITATDDFFLECTDSYSCNGADIVIICDNNEFIKGIKCGGASSCLGGAFTIIGCIVEKIECGNDDACKNADFTFEGITPLKSDEELISCSGGRYKSCSGLMCTADTDGVCPSWAEANAAVAINGYNTMHGYNAINSYNGIDVEDPYPTSFLLLNVMVSMVTTLFVVAVCLTVYYFMVKPPKGRVQWQKVNQEV